MVEAPRESTRYEVPEGMEEIFVKDPLVEEFGRYGIKEMKEMVRSVKEPGLSFVLEHTKMMIRAKMDEASIAIVRNNEEMMDFNRLQGHIDGLAWVIGLFDRMQEKLDSIEKEKELAKSQSK